MANTIEFTSLSAKDFVTSISRYASSGVVYYSGERILTFETYKKTKFVPTKSDQVAVIPAKMEYRPDLVSSEKYGLPDFWWKIMEANGMRDVMDFKAGKTIILPENVYG